MKLKFILLTCSSVIALNVHAQDQKNLGNSSAQKFDISVCNKLVPQIRPQADGCLKLKDQPARQQCFDKIGQVIQKSAPNGACDQVLNPIKQEYIAKEKQLYPTQASALGGPNGNNGPQGNMGSQNGGQPMKTGQTGQMLPAAVCDKLPQSIKPQADECLKMKEQPKRAQCFDKIGQEIQKVAPNGGCDKALDPLKHEIMSKEKQMYPKQSPALK